MSWALACDVASQHDFLTYLGPVWRNIRWFVKFNHDAVTFPKKRKTSRKIYFYFYHSAQHKSSSLHGFKCPIDSFSTFLWAVFISEDFLLFYSMQVSTKALDYKMPVACFGQESVLISSEASWTGSVNILLLYWQLQPYWTLSGLTCIANLPSLFNWKLLTLKCGQRKFMKLDKRSFGSVMFSFHTN